MAKLSEKQQLKQDISDLLNWCGTVVREPCGHLRLVGYICICGKDHVLERRLRHLPVTELESEDQ